MKSIAIAALVCFLALSPDTAGSQASQSAYQPINLPNIQYFPLKNVVEGHSKISAYYSPNRNEDLSENSTQLFQNGVFSGWRSYSENHNAAASIAAGGYQASGNATASGQFSLTPTKITASCSLSLDSYRLGHASVHCNPQFYSNVCFEITKATQVRLTGKILPTASFATSNVHYRFYLQRLVPIYENGKIVRYRTYLIKSHWVWNTNYPTYDNINNVLNLDPGIYEFIFDGHMYFTNRYHFLYGYEFSMWYRATMEAAIEFPMTNPFPHFRQWGEVWSDDDYGDIDGDKISKWGCALSCLAMAVAGLNVDGPGGAEVNPGTLNTWLRNYLNADWEEDGYLGRGLNWTRVFEYTEGKLRKRELDYSPTPTEIEATLQNGAAIIMQVGMDKSSDYGETWKPGSHWVLPTSVQGNNIYFNDPGYAVDNLAGADLAGKAQSKNYLPQRFLIIEPEKPETDISEFEACLLCPAELLVTDPLNQHTGYLPTSSSPPSGVLLTEIPGAVYYHDMLSTFPGEEGNEEVPNTETCIKRFALGSPGSGKYRVDVFGVGSGNYTLYLHARNTSGNDVTETITGYADINSSDEDTVVIDRNSPTRPTMDVMLPGKATGGGKIAKNQSFCTFGFGVNYIESSGVPKGEFTLIDHETQMQVHCISWTTFYLSGTPTSQSAVFKGMAIINNTSEPTPISVCVVDNGEPGNQDMISVKVGNNYEIKDAVLIGGNIQVKKPKKPKK